jgi:hypothetical protein
MEEMDSGYRPPAITITAGLTGDRLSECGFEWPVIDAAYVRRFLSVIGERQTEGRMGD